jgi:hypothetical protein
MRPSYIWSGKRQAVWSMVLEVEYQVTEKFNGGNVKRV